MMQGNGGGEKERITGQISYRGGTKNETDIKYLMVRAGQQACDNLVVTYEQTKNPQLRHGKYSKSTHITNMK